MDLLEKIELMLMESSIEYRELSERRPVRVRHDKSGEARKDRRKAKRWRRTHKSTLRKTKIKRKRITRKQSYKRKVERMKKRGLTPTGRRIKVFKNKL